jgi:predicted dehydrogenase
MATTTHHVGIVMNGVTGRMGSNQHLTRSIVAMIRQGGIHLNDREIIMPDPILVGRNAARLEDLATAHGITRWTTDLGKALADSYNKI